MLVVLLMFALAVPVFAARIEIEQYSGEYEWELIESCEAYGGGDFSVWNRGTYSGFEQFFYNNDDEIIKRKFHESGTDNLFRYDEPDKNIVSGNWQISGFWDVVTDEFKYAGTNWNIHLPGEGNVIHFAGADFFVGDDLVRTAGLQAVDFETICRYFSD
jgi:hypothetical protein